MAKPLANNMWELPLTAIIVTITLTELQRRHYRYKLDQKSNGLNPITVESIAKTQKEFEEYKKRVDGLIVRAGFKL